MPSPSKASIQLPSVSIAQSPFDLPNALVCIRDDAVSRGYMIILDVELVEMNTKSEKKI